MFVPLNRVGFGYLAPPVRIGDVCGLEVCEVDGPFDSVRNFQTPV